MKKSLAIGFLIIIIATLAAVAAPFGGSWSFYVQSNVKPFSIAAMESVLEVDYSIGTWTWSSTVIADLSGLDNVYFDAKGVLGGFALRSIADFDADEAQFQSLIGSAVTAIAGINLYALFMLDNVGSSQTPSMGSGLTLGGWATLGSIKFWGQTRFNMKETSSYIYKYGYAWLLDHFIFQVCDTWQKPSGYIDVQTASCTACWSGADFYFEMPFTCFDVLAQLSFACTGFEYVLFEANNIDLGLGWLDLKWIDVMFTTTSKTMNLVFDVNVGDVVCFTPYLALEGAGGSITGLSLKAMKLEYSWNGLTFKAGDLFDENGWYPYLNYANPSMKYLGWSWDGELTTLLPCLAMPARGEVPYDEYIGIIVGGDSCCGGSSAFSAFAWFDTGNSSGLFDWAETRIQLREEIGTNIAVTFGISVTQGGTDWFRLGTDINF